VERERSNLDRSQSELFGGGVHGSDRDAVLEELRQAVKEVIENARKTGIPFPGPLPAEVHAS